MNKKVICLLVVLGIVSLWIGIAIGGKICAVEKERTLGTQKNLDYIESRYFGGDIESNPQIQTRSIMLYNDNTISNNIDNSIGNYVDNSINNNIEINNSVYNEVNY